VQQEASLFTLTDDARVIVKAIAAQTAGGREAGGIRIYDGSDRGTDFALEPADGPQDGDVVLEQSGAHIFLASDVVDDLDDFVLEASVGPDGVVDFSFGTNGPQGMTDVRSTGGHTH
jgi:Fe-S cluster assembly iron-binding protein IscA